MRMKEGGGGQGGSALRVPLENSNLLNCMHMYKKVLFKRTYFRDYEKHAQYM